MFNHNKGACHGTAWQISALQDRLAAALENSCQKAEPIEKHLFVIVQAGGKKS